MEDLNVIQALRLNYLYSEKYSFPMSWTYYESMIPYTMIRLICNGKGTFVIDDTVYRLEKDDIIYIPQGCKLYCEAHTDDFTFISIRFTAAFPDSDIDMWANLVGYDMSIHNPDPQIIQYFHCIIQEKDSTKQAKFLLIRGYLELILAYLIDTSDKIAAERSMMAKTIKARTMIHQNDYRVQLIVDYMIHHFNKELNVEGLSEMAEVSSTTLRKLFKQHTGKTPKEFLLNLKLTAAAKKIVETDERISDIASFVGIKDPNYFARIFKKNFGVTPHTYRKRVKGF